MIIFITILMPIISKLIFVGLTLNEQLINWGSLNYLRHRNGRSGQIAIGY